MLLGTVRALEVLFRVFFSAQATRDEKLPATRFCTFFGGDALFDSSAIIKIPIECLG